MKPILILLFLLFGFTPMYSQINVDKNNQTHENTWIIKARLLPTLLGYSAAVGLERQIGGRSSILLLFKTIKYSWSSDAPTNNISSLIPEYRYHFNETINNSFFTSGFIELGKHSASLSGEIDPTNYKHNQRGNFIGFGIIIGKNMAIGKRLHIDFYLGPRLRFQNETIITSTNFIATESNQNKTKIGGRFGINFNYSFK